ncbi:transglycosylase domain-containing protein [Streptomyces ficellus]|uniref:Penicillin-binding protein n=1 Tax=Streptomyces ficellus TaxID=1977088 RepID=A0A6I6FHH3_9ACTN|nr:transglycosylase domain-containing protein [Streptomyces ficellus]QGV76938.1 penicillin-binding protein [Streptomyces ficellus]
MPGDRRSKVRRSKVRRPTGVSPGNGRRFRVDYPRRGRDGLRRWLPSWRQLLGLALFGFLGLAALVGHVYLTVEIEDVNADARAEANVYYWADGTQMVSVGQVNRQNVPLSDIPRSLQNAVIATENATFYSDPGFSVRGLGRAVVNMARGQEIQGGSTITQQYVKNTYLTQEQTLDRKLRELCLSVKLSRSLSKQEILQGYLNTSWFGRNAYGVQAAAVAYYGMDAKDLDPARSALLVALLKGGELYDPSLSEAHHRRAVERWSYVLDRQVDLGYMTREERAKYTVFPEPRPESVSTSMSGQIGYLVDVANKYIKNRTGLTTEQLGRGGYRIRTTFDKREVERLRTTVERVRQTSLDPARRIADRDVEIGAASIRPDDGAVLALYGGSDATKHFSNNADTSGVPVGSAFTPFVLAAALQNGVGATGDDVPLALRQGLVRGDSGLYSRVGEAVGLDRVRDLAVGSGLLPLSMAPLEPSFPTGTSTPSAIRMAGAYATFAADGRQTDPYSVIAASHLGTPVEGLERPTARRALDAEVAREVSGALRDVAVDVMAPDALRALPPVAAGRTGADDRTPASWFVGYTDRLSTAVTVFRSRPGTEGLLPMRGVAGSESDRADFLPLRVWSSYMADSPASRETE